MTDSPIAATDGTEGDTYNKHAAPQAAGTKCEGEQRGVHDPFALPSANGRNWREVAA